MQMTFILIYWLGNLQALLAQTAQALPFLILMTLLAGRKGNAALCLWGGRQLLRLGLFCAALSLPLFPLMLLLETLRQPQMPPLADLLVQPASVALLAWLPATLLLWGLLRASRHWPDATDPAITAYRTTDLRLTLWGCLLALLLFLLGSLLSTGLLLEPPQGMERSNFILLQIRQALHLLFRYLSLAGGAALLWLWYLRHRAPLTDERAFTLAIRWCAVWAVVGYLPSIIDFWSTLLAALLTARCQKKWLAPLPPVIANTVLIGLVLAYEQAGTSAAFWPTYAFNALTVGLGEAVACYGLGGLLLWRLDKSNALQHYLQNR